jgi:predicted ATPase/DNA-binding CsgD family transcriptional regulator
VAGNLRAELTSFVGRRHELTEVRRLLSGARLVTLVGVGGVGKTRLAVHAAAEMRRAFPDGVWLAELEMLSDPGLVPQAVAQALGLRDEAFAATDRLVDYLDGKSLLLVLDNCEHLADACAVLVGKLLAGSSGVRVLATSRHRLGAEGEQLLPVEPFAVPDDEVVSEPEGRAGHEALMLFADRAAAVAPGFDLAHHRSTVSQICRRLDGLPLAIELAVVWLRTLSPEQILAHLDDQFALLTTGSRTALPRQQRLAALIEWSYRLCSEQERAAWTRLAVFSGGFDLPAAEEVCAFGTITQDDVLGLVAGLVDKSIVVREKETFGRTARYRMLNTIQGYATSVIDPAERAEATARHFGYFRRLAAEYREAEFTARQQERALLLRRDHANLRRAMASGLESDRADHVLEMVADLVNFWIAAGLLADGYRWLDRALVAAAEPSRTRARALRGWIMVCLWFGVHHGLRARLAELGELAEALGDPATEFDARTCAGFASYIFRDLAHAGGELEGALAEVPEGVDLSTRALALANLCMTRFLLDKPDAEEPGREALALCEAHGRPQWPTAYATWALGIATWRRDTRRATELEREAIRLQAPVGDHSGMALSMDSLAWCAASEGHHERAARLLGTASMLWRLGGAGRIGGSLAHVSDEHASLPARKALGEQAFKQAFAEGAACTVDQAVAHALSDKPPARRKAATAKPAGELTRREFEIAGLVAEGLSNKELGTRLVISQRTAEAHVEHILAKLGFTSRVQIAAWFAQQDDL